MSAEDIIRSFAESREPDDAVIRDGITYGVARQLRARIEELEKDRDWWRGHANDEGRSKLANRHELRLQERATASLSAEVTRLSAKVEELEGTLRDFRDNWDCDEDAHTHGTRCRACAAAQAIGEKEPLQIAVCAYCGGVINRRGWGTIHRDGFGVGPEVPLCGDCGDYLEPSCEQIWERIAQPSDEPCAYRKKAGPDAIGAPQG